MITRTKTQVTTTPSAPAANIVETFTAGAVINGHRVLMMSVGDVVHFDPTDENNYERIIGLSNQAAIMGASVQVVLEGIINNPGWGLSPGIVYYADLDGLITTTPPTSGISVIIGVAVDANNLRILLHNAVITA